MPPRILPIIVDLGAHGMAPEPRMVIGTLPCEMIVAKHHHVAVHQIERGEAEARLAQADAKQAVVFDEFLALAAAHERGELVAELTLVDLVGTQEPKIRLVPTGASRKIRYSEDTMAQALNQRVRLPGAGKRPVA